MNTIEKAHGPRKLTEKALTLDLALAFALLMTTCFFRTIAANAFVTWDEPAWVYRSIKFLMALLRHDPAGTLLTGHPGVLTMWSGALSLGWHTLVLKQVPLAQLAAIDALPGLDVHDPELLRQLGLLLPLAKGGLGFLHGLIAVALYLVLSRLLDRRYAVAGSLFLACDPFYLALTRVLHIDALASALMLLAFLSILFYARDGRRRYLILSGGTATLAILTKSYGLFVVPVAGLVMLGAWWRADRELPRAGAEMTDGGQLAVTELARRRPVGRLLGAMALWGGAALLAAALLWPAFRAIPVRATREILGTLLNSAQSADTATADFFRGQIVDNPGWLFYPIVMLFRATPLVLMGSLFAILGLWPGLIQRFPLRGSEYRPARGESPASTTRRGLSWALVLYILLYVIAISISKKKFGRYALPALLSMDLLAALGWAQALDWAWRLLGGLRKGHAGLKRILGGVFVPALVLGQAFFLLGPLYPAHYLAYFNPWMGGASRAEAMIPVGWGEGIDEIVGYLSAKPEAASLTVATWAMAGVAPAFPGNVVAPDEEHLPYADYVLLYVGDTQSNPTLASYFASQSPEKIVQVNGINYAWLYANNDRRRLVQEVKALACSGDVLVTDGPSGLGRELDGLFCADIMATTEAEVAAQLGRATADARDVLYLEFEAGNKASGQSIRRQLAQNALLLWEKPLTFGVLRRYRLLEQRDFRELQPTTGTAAAFGQELALDSYGLSRATVQYRQGLGIVLDWRARQQPTQDYHLFLRLVDDAGRVWGQEDAPLVDDDLQATSAWEADTCHRARLTLSLKAGIPPGQYGIEMGVYRLDDLTRLPVEHEKGQVWTGEFRVASVEVISPALPATREELAIPHPLTRGLQGMRLLGYGLSEGTVESGDTLDLALYWSCSRRIINPHYLELRLEKDGVPVATQAFDPGGPDHPPATWVPGETLQTSQQLAIPVGLGSGSYNLYLRVHWIVGDFAFGRNILLAHVPVQHRERLYTIPTIASPQEAVLGQEIELLGYALGDDSILAGGALPLTLYWRALRPPQGAYTVFAHLLDDQGAFRDGQDSIPVQGTYPTDRWTADEVVIDRREIPLSAETPPGVYRIEVGLYDARTGRRLPVALDGRPDAQDRVLLSAEVSVQ